MAYTNWSRRPSTGIVTRICMGTKGMVAGVVGQYMHIVDVPEFEITPVFQGKDLRQDVS